MAPQLSVGFGASCITPPLPCRLAGYSRREALSWQVAQELWARSIVLDDGKTRIGWVICDLLAVSRSFVADVRAAVEATGCLAGHDVMVSATHTHAGPELYGDWGTNEGRDSGAQAHYRGFLPYAVATAVVAAVQDLSAASLSWADSTVLGVGASRRANGEQPPRLGVLEATVDGRLKGMVIVYPCHGTVMGPDNLAVSGDIIGACIKALESSTGAIGRCAWAQGAAGDVSTRGNRRERSQREADRLGSLVATAALEARARAEPLEGELHLGLKRLVIPLPLKTADQYIVPEAAALVQRDDADRSEAALLEEAMAARRQHSTRPGEDQAEVAYLRIGDLSLCFMPGEPFGAVERAVVDATGLAGLRVVGYSNGAPGYIFGPDEELRGGYEVLSSPLTGEASTRIVGTAASLVSAQEQ